MTWLLVILAGLVAGNDGQTRPPLDEVDRIRWLDNMVRYHQFSVEEAAEVLGRTPEQVKVDLERHQIRPGAVPPRELSTVVVLPYPGGRHPRLGFLDGAVDPQRDTKVSVFTPWDPSSYVVADVPEAIWSNLGLTYLAHTHIPTIWDARNISLDPHEWTIHKDGSLSMERVLPNGIAFGTVVRPQPDGCRFEQWLRNGTKQTLSDLRVQNCMMLGRARGFEAQTGENKVIRPPYVAARSDDGKRWIIAGWEPIHRAWENPPVPCIHADPRFPDCPPGATRTVRGVLYFFQGDDLDEAIEWLDRSGWKGEAP